MKIRVRDKKLQDQAPKKYITTRKKYKNYRIATYILAASWIIVGIIYYGQKIW